MLVHWRDKPKALLDANPMGKLPTIVHHHGGHDRVVSEAAAVCHYLAEMEAPELLPRPEEKADYFRWLLFAAGPVEQAVTARSMGWEVPSEREVMAGFGSFGRTVDTLDWWLSSHDYVCGNRFTMADVYVGSAVDWGLGFGTLPEREAFAGYRARFQKRDGYRAAKAIDNRLIEEMKNEK